jgi:hypothetical protein
MKTTTLISEVLTILESRVVGTWYCTHKCKEQDPAVRAYKREQLSPLSNKTKAVSFGHEYEYRRTS